jgi:two-component system chemotaxis response regulator CheB
MFNSILESYGSKVVAVMLTGMGADGAEGMLKLKQAGAITYAQDEATSVVWGMPQAALNIGAVDEVLPLQKISEKMLKSAQQK